MAIREVKITATIEDDSQNEISQTIIVDIEDTDGETFNIDFEFIKDPANGGPIVMPKPPKM